VVVEVLAMSVLTLTPHNWFSWNFSLFDGDRALAEVKLSSWRERGTLMVEGVEYTVYRESFFGDFLLQQSGSMLARAEKPSIFYRSFIIRYKEKSYTLQAESAFRRAFVLLDGDREVGSIVPKSAFTRNSVVTLPDEWPLPIKSFAIWLTIVHWRRDANAGSG
jgi:hypothetical protein